MTDSYEVAIVGGGPVGLGLAVELGLRGIRCKVVERYPDIQKIPKGQNLTQRTLEHFHSWGIADELRKARLMPRSYPASGIVAYGNLMSDYWHKPLGREKLGDFYFQANERLPQYLMEKVLRDKAAEIPEVEVLYGWQGDRIEQDADGVRLFASERSGTSHLEIRADYLVGCDGARSTVAEQIGIEKGSADFDQLMVLAVFKSSHLDEILKRFPGDLSTFRAIHPDAKGYWKFFGRVDPDGGWFFHAPVEKNTTRENFDFKALLHRVVGCEFDLEFEYIGFWEMRIAVADRYQVGRAFIAGDAAHSHPPYGGYGVNNGLEDIRNLGWKLDARIHGWGTDALLESYSLERRPIFRETADDFIGNVIANERAFGEKYAPEKNKIEFERAWAELGTGIVDRVGQYEPNYEGSPIICGPIGGRTSAHGDHLIKARPGHHLAPRSLSSGRNVYEELGNGFSLIALDAAETVVSEFRDAASRFGIPLKVVRDSYAGHREAYQSRLILVRPDHYVVWAGDERPGDTATIFRHAVGL